MNLLVVSTRSNAGAQDGLQCVTLSLSENNLCKNKVHELKWR